MGSDGLQAVAGERERRLELLIETGRTLVSELDLEAVLQRVLDAARELTSARYAAVGVLDEHGAALERFLTVGIDEETHRAIGDLPRGRGVLGVLIREPEPLRLADVGKHARSYGFPLGHPPMKSFLGVPILVRGKPYGNLYLTEKEDGDEFDEQDEKDVVVLADWAAIAIENARGYAALDARREELERLVSTFDASSEIAQALAGGTDLDRILELVVKRGRALTDARSMLLLLEQGDDLVVAALAGELDDSLIGHRIPIAETAAGHVLRTGIAERLADVPGRLRFALAEQTNAESGLFVPLRVRGRSLGVLAAFDRLRDGPRFSAWDEQVLSGFAATPHQLWPVPGTRPPRCCVGASSPRSRSEAAGRASFTTRRCRNSPGSSSPSRRSGARTTQRPAARQSTPPLLGSTSPSRRCGGSSPISVPQRSTISGSSRRSRP